MLFITVQNNKGVKNLHKYAVPGLLLLLVCMTSGKALAQASLEGRVLDERGNGLPAASVHIESLGLHVHTGPDGGYALPLRGNMPKTVTLRYTFIGYEPRTVTLVPDTVRTEIPTVVLRPSSLALEAIEVQAAPGRRSNSSLVMDREQIERYPSLSLNDLLNFLPNRKIAAPSVQQMQNLTLRGAFTPLAWASSWTTSP